MNNEIKFFKSFLLVYIFPCRYPKIKEKMNLKKFILLQFLLQVKKLHGLLSMHIS
jgi:hypothetical protein